ncbi:PAS domain-containing protein [Leptolyngbya sp. FACHB-711]|uniref:PAS domain-containing protein n=1 Tax=unclassified Leptolyngbya TaxID=2650499 RepID=UPI001688D1B0|nr:PAS domain-containing protein [Cyanobacteria bacterium FACHB-502]MBD2025940.1 PAS domain-containing protein [Leptolyngbya sp. FACHB-711]
MAPANSGSSLSLEKILENISALALQIQQCRDLEEILQWAIADTRSRLQTDRVLIYCLREDGNAVIAYESAGAEWTPLIGQVICDRSFNEIWVERYRQGEVAVICDIRAGDLPASSAERWEWLQGQANLVAPIGSQGNLWGLLIVHDCRSPGEWQPIEMQYLQQVALHLGIAVQQANLQQSQQGLVAELDDRQRQIYQALQTSENRLSLALKAANAGMWQWDLITNQTFWSEENYRLLGYEPQIHNPSYQNWLNAIHPDDREAADRFVTQALAEKRNCSIEYRVLLPDNQVRWSADIGEILYDADGNPTGIIGIQIDITERKRVENERKQAELALQQLNQELELRVQKRTLALQQSEACWQFALEGAGDGVWDWNIQTNQIAFSWQWGAILDDAEPGGIKTLEEWNRRIHPDDRASCNDKLADHLSGKTPIYQNEYRVYCKDGSEKWILDRGKVVEWTATGKPLRMIGIHTDITDRKQAEEQRQALANRLKLAVEAAHMGVWDWDLVNDCLVSDDRIHELYGIQLPGAVDSYAAWEACVHPDDLPTRRAAIQQALVEKTAVKSEFRAILPDGTLRYIESCTLVLRDAAGTPIRIIGIDLDISERKRVDNERKAAEAALREQQQLTEQIAESTLAILYIYDLIEQRNVYCSQQVEAVLGYSSAEVQAMGDLLFVLLIHPDDMPRVIQNQQNFSQMQENEFLETEYRMRHKSGDFRWLLGRDKIWNRTPAGNPRQVVGVAVDITALKEYEATLHQQAERERLLTTIAQNIRKTLDLEQILDTAVIEVRRLLQVDRAIIYRFEAGWSGLVVAESVAEGWQSLLGRQITDTYFAETQVQLYFQGQITAVDDIYRASLTPCYLEMLEQIQVRALLVVPILQNDHLWGLLVAHHCHNTRQWESFEMALQEQLATQLAIAIQQSELHQQVQILNAELELQVQERTAQLQQSLHFEELLKRITDKVRDSLDEQQILQVVVEELAKDLPIEACDTGIYNAEQTLCTIVYEFTNTLSPIQGQTFEIAKAPHSEIHLSLLQGQLCQFCGLTTNTLRSGQQLLTILACPIRDEKGILGEIWLFKYSQELFNELEVRLVQQVANQCAIALRQSRLFQAAQQQVQELERLNQLKDDFLSTVSHELRTPMSNIGMATHMLGISLEQLGILTNESNPIARYFNVLRTEGQREISLIDNLLDLTRLDAGTDPLNFTSIGLQYYLPHLAESFVERARQQQQQFAIHIPSDLPPLITDMSYLGRILSELLNNACKYTPSGEAIALAAQATPEHLAIRISNSGVEIPPAEHERIFDKFYRIPNSDPWKYDGTGLGLALVKKLVQRLGSRIRVESAAGQTAFIVEFKISA